MRLIATSLLISPALPLAAPTNTLPAHVTGKIQKGEMAGYLLVPNEKVPETYNAGYSMYVAAGPLLNRYPGQRFQTGLFGTWMFAQKDASASVKFLHSWKSRGHAAHQSDC